MKITHVVRQYLPSIGGMEEVVRNLAAAQRDTAGFEPSIITLDRIFRESAQSLPRSELLEGVPVRRIGWRGSERYPLAPAVLGAIRDADIVHVHGIDFFFDYLAVTKPLHRKCLVASTHGGFFHTPFAQGLKRVFFNTVTRSSALGYARVIGTSESDGEIFSQVVAPTRLRVIENGVDIEKYRNAASSELRPVLIYFGRWSANKGLLEALDLFARLRVIQSDRDWRFIIAGREYDLNQAALRARAEALGIASAVQLEASPSNERLRALVAEASYFICLSHHEGFGIAPIEAMSAGLLPVLSAIPPFLRLREASGEGLVLDSRDASSGAERLAGWHAMHEAAGPDEFLALRKRVQAAVQAYSWQGVAKAYARQYSEAMAR